MNPHNIFWVLCILSLVGLIKGRDEDDEICEFARDGGFDNWFRQLWEADTNRLTPGVDFKLNLQGRTRFSYDGPDNADEPLFSYVNPRVFDRPTYKTFVALLDNYETSTGVAEIVTANEQNENWAFINAIMKTKVMELAYKFLRYKGKTTKDLPGFKQDLYDMWFKLYRRSREIRQYDSSGFEHVFVGETRGDKEVIGFHNWIRFYMLEKQGVLDYKGFMGSDKNPRLLTIQFDYKGEVKPKGSMFLGVSPEFEMALYTVVYLTGCSAIKSNGIVLKAHTTAGKIGTVYPQMPAWRPRKQRKY